MKTRANWGFPSGFPPRWLAVATFGVWLALTGALAHGVDRLAMRNAALTKINALDGAGPGLEVALRFADGSPRSWARIGETLDFRLTAVADGYVMVIYIDSQGGVTLEAPRFDNRSNFLSAGQTLAYPNGRNTFSQLAVQPPLGPLTILMIASATPLDARDFGSPRPHQALTFGVDQLEVVLEPLFRAHSHGEVGPLTVVETSFTVLGRSPELALTAEDIVAYFKATRSVSRTELPFKLPIHFDVDRSHIKDDYRRQLDEWCRALGNPLLQGVRFNITGHTDDLGPMAYNDQLAAERAEVVFSHFTERCGLDARRFARHSYGELMPLVPNISPENRAMNRRVEVEQAVE